MSTVRSLKGWLVRLGKKNCHIAPPMHCSDILTPHCSAFTWLLFMCSMCTKHLLAKQKKIVENYLSVLLLPLSTQHFIQAKMIRVGDCMYMEATECGWVQSLDWTTGLTQTAKNNSFSAEQKLNVLIPSVTSWSFQRSKVTCILISFTFGGYT